MNSFLKMIFFGVIFMFSQGCANSEKFAVRYDAWLGQPIDGLVKQVGYPDSTYVLPSKNKVYVYERSRIYTTPSMPMFGYGYGGYGGYGMVGYSYGGDVVQKTCKVFLETDKKGIIVRWGSRGNDCISN